MKTKNIVFVTLWVALSGIPQVSQADDTAAMQGVMDVMRTMQQSGPRADPGGKALMDIFGEALRETDNRGDRRDDRDRSEQRGGHRGRPAYDDGPNRPSGDRREQRRKQPDYGDNKRPNRPDNDWREQRRSSGDNDSDRPNRQSGYRGDPQRKQPDYGDSGRRSERQRSSPPTGMDSGRRNRNQD
ncbi:MAG: hypothetical protein WAW42_17115 [Candidatus Competibacteraceae bacterium]